VATEFSSQGLDLDCVLLTRGRDCTVIYVPDDRRMDATFERLRAVGMREL
jgi:hypothetical protein